MLLFNQRLFVSLVAFTATLLISTTFGEDNDKNLRSSIIRQHSAGLIPPNSKAGLGADRIEPIFIKDNAGVNSTHFVVPQYYAAYLDRILLTNGFIKDRVEKLASDIMQHYGNDEVHLICLLKGCRVYLDSLTRSIEQATRCHSPSRIAPPYKEHYMRVKTYEGVESTSDFQVTTMSDLSVLQGKHILIVEDIIDTGFTLNKFTDWLEANVQPKDVKVTALLEKRTAKSNGFKGDFVGFSVPDAFLVGFGLDYNEMFRDLNHIAVINEKGIKHFA